MTKTAISVQNVLFQPYKKPRKPRSEQTFVSNAVRLELLILIREFGLSCYLAARVLNLPYTNAKQIYRIYKEESRITSNARIKQSITYSMSE